MHGGAFFVLVFQLCFMLWDGVYATDLCLLIW